MTVTDDRPDPIRLDNPPDPKRLDDLPDVMRPPEVAEFLRTTVNSLSASRLSGRGPAFVRAGRKILYRRQDIESYLQRNTVQHDE